MIVFAPVIRMVPHCNITRSYVNSLLLLFLIYLGDLLNTFHLGENIMTPLLMAITNLLLITILLEIY
ncbi:hypothetical protein BD770DRAFT_381753 [Pilaira anomala]|nr:hypothetical protein BD770DRAFT_381753 [Pilaira anomala]